MAKKFSELRERMSPQAREESRQLSERLRAEMPLSALRKAQEYSQATLAATMGTSQGEVSKIEQRTDMYVSTLRSYIEAMGGQLNITAVFPTGEYAITQFAPAEQPTA